jgi:ribulose 1,5-bisphosphate carboxylase large subunit-like protein
MKNLAVNLVKNDEAVSESSTNAVSARTEFQMREEVKFERTNAHAMYMEAYNSSATATEMKNTVDSLVKLHGLTAPDNAVQVNVNLNATAKQLERLTDEELLEIAGKDTTYLEPEG